MEENKRFLILHETSPKHFKNLKSWHRDRMYCELPDKVREHMIQGEFDDVADWLEDTFCRDDCGDFLRIERVFGEKIDMARRGNLIPKSVHGFKIIDKLSDFNFTVHNIVWVDDDADL